MDIRRVILQICIVMSIVWLSGRVFGIVGVISVISVMLLYRLVRIFRKGENVLKKILGWLGSIIYISAIIFSSWKRDWLGLTGLILIFIFLLIYRLFHLFSNWGFIKDLMVQQWKTFEKIQLGRDLDDPYWDTHKKPSWLELIRGKYVPKDLKGKVIKDERIL